MQSSFDVNAVDFTITNLDVNGVDILAMSTL
jgi:hypothetical protein